LCGSLDFMWQFILSWLAFFQYRPLMSLNSLIKLGELSRQGAFS
jgi:hypothetical protein